MGITNFDQVQANAFLGPPPQGNPFGTTYYVSTTGSDAGSRDGKSPSNAWLTIAYAISRSLAGDNFIIAPGTYAEAVLNPLAHQSFRAGLINSKRPSVVISTAVTNGVTVDVDGCQFYGIEFKATAAAVTTLINFASVAISDGLLFDSCVFNGADQTTVVGITNAHATIQGSRLVVRNCLFRNLTGHCISIGAMGNAYGYIGYNNFSLDVASGTGINLASTTAFVTSKGYVIEHNTFIGFSASASEVGITIAGTENTTGAGIIRNNYFSYCAAAAITIDKLSLSEVNNYYGDAATGGTLVDPGT